MSYKILTKNGIDNTNIDGARSYHFNTGMRSGIVKGALNEGKFSTNASNSIFLDACELIISGHRIVIDEPVYKTFANVPSTPTRYSFVAQVIVDDSRNVEFSIFVQSANEPLVQDNLYKTINGAGTYQLEIGKFTLQTDGTISDLTRTADIITGGIDKNENTSFNVGNVTTNTLESNMEAEVDIEQRVDPQDGKTYTDFSFNIPKGEDGFGVVRQTTGTSTTDVMSQKAVTDALSGRAAKDASNLGAEDKNNWKATLGINTVENSKANKDASNLEETDVEAWREKLGSGLGLPLGILIPATIVQDDPSLHLADGSVFSMDGVYADFCTWVKARKAVGDANVPTCTQEEFSNSVATYGQCAKYVIDDTARTIRLPIITEFVASSNGGKVIGLAELDSFKSHTHEQEPHRHSLWRAGDGGSNWTGLAGSPDNNYAGNYDIDYTTAINKSTGGTETKPKNVRLPYYIVVATSVKTQVQIDIEKYVNDLNLKAAKDASNLSSTNVQSWKDVLKSYSFETIYDKNSNNSAINWGYTSGIPNATNIKNKDFSKYKKLIFTCVGEWDGLILIMDLTHVGLGNNYWAQLGGFHRSSADYWQSIGVMALVYGTKTEMEFYCCYENKDVARFRIVMIEGAY